MDCCIFCHITTEIFIESRPNPNEGTAILVYVRLPSSVGIVAKHI